MGCETNSCETKKESKKSCCSSGCEMTDGILKMAEDAWAMAVKEKMKQHFLQTADEHLSKVAQAGVKASMTYWQNKMKGKMEMHQEFDNIKKSMMG